MEPRRCPGRPTRMRVSLCVRVSGLLCLGVLTLGPLVACTNGGATTTGSQSPPAVSDAPATGTSAGPGNPSGGPTDGPSDVPNGDPTGGPGDGPGGMPDMGDRTGQPTPPPKGVPNPPPPGDLPGGPVFGNRTLTGTIEREGSCTMILVSGRRWALDGAKSGALSVGARVTVQGTLTKLPATCEGVLVAQAIEVTKVT
jgi:hypothetical protein